jgi:hypothetical protein
LSTALILIMLRTGTLLCALLLSGCSYWPSGSYFKGGVAQYRGDGIIRDVSQRKIFFGTRGYVIEMEAFDLGSRYDKHFQMADLPIISRSSVGIYLAVEDMPFDPIDVINRVQAKIKATMSISLTDSSGVVVTGGSAKIGAMWWSSPVHGYPGWWLYTEKGSGFKPRPKESYTLHVQYAPDTTLKGKRGRICLSSLCGGS